jgi:hypothetical protein
VKLVLAAIPFMLPNISMPQATQMLLKADSLMFKSKYAWPLLKAFYPRGLLPSAGIKSIVAKQKLLILNSLGFMVGEEAVFWSDNEGTMNIYTVSGQKVNVLKVNRGWNQIKATNFAPGTWIFEFNGFRFKLLKSAF